MATTVDDGGGGGETAKLSTTERVVKSEYFRRFWLGLGARPAQPEISTF